VISYGFNILLLLLSAPPAYAILLSSRFEPQITMADVCYFLIAVSFVAFESYCDAKMWAYQSTKYKYREDAKVPHGWKQEDLDRGFITSGPWQYSRHPNFISEQIIWFILYQWSCYATNNLYSWTGIGSGCIFLVFQGSTLITEGVTAGKYPEYRDYQSQVGMFFPTSLTGYTPPSREAPVQEGTAKQPKVIRTSELLKRYEEKESKKQK
jgi:steroid 5-alpha reductase family enzyme